MQQVLVELLRLTVQLGSANTQLPNGLAKYEATIVPVSASDISMNRSSSDGREELSDSDTRRPYVLTDIAGHQLESFSRFLPTGGRKIHRYEMEQRNPMEKESIFAYRLTSWCPVEGHIRKSTTSVRSARARIHLPYMAG